MTSEAPDLSDEDFIVTVRAQVMTRDDSKGGWVPLGGGGMSVIGLCRLVTTGREKTSAEFFICGHRIVDKSVVLKCTLKKDLQYTRANPTFHHWRTEGGRFGLTFQSSTDARVFEKGVRRAVDSLRHGPLERTVRVLKGEDQDIFMSLNLPLERKDSISRPESTASTTVSTPSAQSPTSPAAPESSLELSSTPSIVGNSHAERVDVDKEANPKDFASNEMSTISKKLAWYFTFPPVSEKNSAFQCANTCTSLPDSVLLHKNKVNKDWMTVPSGVGAQKLLTKDVDDRYVEIAKKTIDLEYSYPQLEGEMKSTSRLPLQSNVISSIPISVSSLQVVPKTSCQKDGSGEDRPTRRLLSQRLKCVHCQEMFVPEENRHGSCVDAPDPVASCIEGLTCSCCARALLYHCMAKAEDNEPHPCTCNASDKNNCKRWTLLSFLSLVIPCLWCYWPLTLCHRCGINCRCCGGRHEAAD